MRLRLCPLNPIVGDVDGNAAKIRAAIGRAASAGADALVLPELAMCGYPPRDLLLQEGFVEACERAVEALSREVPRGLAVIVGTPWRDSQALGNALVVLKSRRIDGVYRKRLLPTYDVFDEDRYFESGRAPCVIKIAGVPTGLAICEDLWKGDDAGLSERYAQTPDPTDELKRAGAQLIVSASASPFVLGKAGRHADILRAHARRLSIPVVSVNQLGGNDELIFDGHAFVVAPDGSLRAALHGFTEEELDHDLGADAPAARDSCVMLRDDAREALFEALVLGVRDYARKTGFRGAIIGLSGGIDSALTAVLAVRALGAPNVVGVAMPGPYSSEHARADAAALAANISVRLIVAPITAGFDGARASVDHALLALGLPKVGATLPDLVEENLQSRVRGTLLMALSNRTGSLVLTTGNKSELAVGYCTLYGDMNGGLAAISDLTKGQVYDLARWINAHHSRVGFPIPPIPVGSLSKPPSAELRPGQTDQDTLPPYDILDEIVQRTISANQSPAHIARATGFDPAVVGRISRLIALAEYKRRQATIGLKVSPIAFGSGRRMPVAQRWKPENIPGSTM